MLHRPSRQSTHRSPHLGHGSTSTPPLLDEPAPNRTLQFGLPAHPPFFLLHGQSRYLLLRWSSLPQCRQARARIKLELDELEL